MNCGMIGAEHFVRATLGQDFLKETSYDFAAGVPRCDAARDALLPVVRCVGMR